MFVELVRTLRLGLRPHARMGIATTLAALGLWLMLGLGVPPALNTIIEHGFYQQRGARPIDARTVLVRIDDETVAQWGPPPWTWAQLQSLVTPILGDRPSHVALLDSGPLILPSSVAPAAVTAAQNSGVLVLPHQSEWQRQSSVSRVAGRVTADFFDAQGLATPFALLLTNVSNAPAPRPLIVNFTTPEALPTLSALHVVRREVPTGLFANKLVLIGLTGHYAPSSVETPVGNLAPAAVLAHGISAAAAQHAWHVVPRWQQWAAVGLLMLLMLRLLARLRSSWWIALSAGGVLGLVLVAGYLLFRSAILIDSGVLLCATLSATLAGLLLERNEMGRTIDATRPAFANTVPRSEDPQALIARFHQSAARFLRADTSLWADLPLGGWHLEIRNATGAHANTIVENRRDIRRSPWSEAYLAMQPKWSNREFFQDVEPGQTLLVPVASHGRLIGIFVFVVTAELREGALAIMEDMAASLGIQLAAAARPLPATSHATALLDQLQDASRAAAALRTQHAETIDIVHDIPVGIVVATTWGQIRSYNPAILVFAKQCGMTLTPGHTFEELVTALTAKSPDQVHDLLRDVAVDGAPQHLTTPSRAQITLARHGGSGELAYLSLTMVQLIEAAPKSEPLAPKPEVGQPPTTSTPTKTRRKGPRVKA
ncbi:MAG: CHASE2 domain-containing protein [Kofleriaceae bacterium]|nr:CHASE2 domain-containing protein [Kofleriaceae bacterium]